MCSFGNIVKLLDIAQRRVCSVYDGITGNWARSLTLYLSLNLTLLDMSTPTRRLSRKTNIICSYDKSTETYTILIQQARTFLGANQRRIHTLDDFAAIS